jgi:SAM-dependent methyltransferase
VAQPNYPLALGQVMQIAARTRLQELEGQLANAFNWIVQTGPFAGMSLPQEGSWGDLAPKLLGCYESELHPAVERAIARGPDLVVNVGCAEGYYAVGLARRLPGAKVYAFDIDPKAQAVCAQAAQQNGVGDRVVVGGRCDAEQLAELAAGGRKVLVVMDCEGGELGLLSDTVVDALSGADILVECHDFVDRTLTQTLAPRLQRRHRVERLREGARDPAGYPVLQSVGSFDRWLLVCEFRPEVMSWLACWSSDADRGSSAA